VPGLAIIGGAIGLGLWLNANRLVFYEDTGEGMGVGMHKVSKAGEEGTKKKCLTMEGEMGEVIRFK